MITTFQRIVIAFFILHSQTSYSETSTLAAIDLGSGKFKLLIAAVDDRKIEIKFTKTIDVRLGEDLAANNNGLLSEHIQLRAVTALRELKELADAHGVIKIAAIATGIFRKAKNGEELLCRLSKEANLKIQLLPQNIEGILGFHNAVVLNPDIPIENIISWDSGNASFQITAKNGTDYSVYEGPLGCAAALKAFTEEVRNIPYTQELAINPVLLEEITKLVEILGNKIQVPEWLERKLQDPKTVVLSYGDPKFFSVFKGNHENAFTQESVWKILEGLSGRTNDDSQILAINKEMPSTVVIRLTLLYAVMHKFNIRKVTFKESPGSTPGMFFMSELW